jgi:soluble lytic murein transglycosylase-like protein
MGLGGAACGNRAYAKVGYARIIYPSPDYPSPDVASLNLPNACDAAGRAAEQGAALPANLLLAIGRVESGRIDAATGGLAPWPWTVNVDGAGHYFQSEPEAAAFVRLAESAGARDIDVGCFQISLAFHPAAFSSLDAAFDPLTNANVAAQFLDQLKMQAGSWNLAIADYHSGEPALGLPYQRRVLAAWQGIGEVPLALGALAFAAVDPGVILQAPAARLVRVITLDAVWGPPQASRLPRVITP